MCARSHWPTSLASATRPDRILLMPLIAVQMFEIQHVGWMPERQAQPEPFGQDGEFFIGAGHGSRGVEFAVANLLRFEIPKSLLDSFQNGMRHD